MSKKHDTTGTVWQLDLFSKGKSSLLKTLRSLLLNSTTTSYIVTPNPEQVVQAHFNQNFLHSLHKADFILPDGWGVVWAWQLLNKENAPKNRVSGRKIVAALLEMVFSDQTLAEKKVLVLGGRDYAGRGVKFSVVEVGQSEVEELPAAAVYWMAGYEKVSQPTTAEKSAVKKAITELQPDIVFVAFGAPQQELWLQQHREDLEQAKVTLAMAVGGSFDYLLGLVPACPRWVEQLRVEWLWRLTTQPWRLRRQTRLLVFVWLVVVEKCRRLFSITR